MRHPGRPPGRTDSADAGWRVDTFAALRHRNFRLFFTGQLISLIGTWMQRIAQSWLILQLTNSPFLLGVVSALQWLPVLCFSLVGGVTADRVSKRGLLVVTQTLQMLQAFTLGALIATGAIRYWHVVALAAALGLTAAFDIPARQAFIFEMVEGEHTMNAVALNSAIFNAARLFGPAIAGLAIGWAGMAWAFLANGVSFIPVIIAFLLMRVRPLELVEADVGLVGHLQEGIAHLRRSAVSQQVIALIGAQSIFAMNLLVLVPVLARDVLHQEAAGFGFLMSAQGAGALVGGLAVASISAAGPQMVFLFCGAGALSLADLALAWTRFPPQAAVILGIAGVSLVLMTATANTTLQVTAPDHLRGRVMAMYAIVMGGMTPIGALLAGGLAQAWGAPGALAAGGTLGLLATGGILSWRAHTAPAPSRTSGPSLPQFGGGETEGTRSVE